MVITISRDGRILTRESEAVWLLDKFQEFNQDKERFFRLTFKDGISLLDRRVHAYHADDPEGSEPRSRINAPGNQALRDIVDNNFGPFAQPGRRINELQLAPISTLSPVVEKEIAYKKVLSTLQQIARTSIDKGTPIVF